MSRTSRDHDPQTTADFSSGSSAIPDDFLFDDAANFDPWLDSTRPPLTAEEVEAEWEAMQKELDKRPAV